MADYAIRLNLGGNAATKLTAFNRTLDASIRKTQQLTRALALADKAKTPMTGREQIRLAQLQKETAEIRRQTMALQRRNNVARQGTTGSGRVRNNDFARIGWSRNIGGFSFGLNRILQPDANGNILGMNANRLMMGGGIAALTTTVAKNVLKGSLWATAGPLVMGGGGLMAGMRMLQSEGMRSGANIISRRRQARLGLGEELYEQAQQNADALASSYGFDRGTMLSAINVLTGSAIAGNSKNRMGIGQATSLAKVGGLISQQSGAPIEKVLTNIQQIFTQSVPNLRDIRELLMQAPVLQKFAVADMEARGISGVDVRDYLKDPGAVARTFARYELTNASNAAMRARGQLELSRQDMWASIAGNDKAWTFFGNAGADFLTTLGSMANTLLTAASSSTVFMTMVEKISVGLEMLSENSGEFFTDLASYVDAFAARYGIKLTGAERKARENVGVKYALQTGLSSNEVLRAQLFSVWNKSYGIEGETPSIASARFQQHLDEVSGKLMRDRAVRSAVTPDAELTHVGDSQRFSWFERAVGVAHRDTRAENRIAEMDYPRTTRHPGPGEFRVDAGFGKGTRARPEFPALSYLVQSNPIVETYQKIVEQGLKMSGDLTKIAGGGSTDSTQAGADLTGMNRDRRSLVINFNDKIAEVNNYVNGGSTSDIVRQIETNNEEAIGRAIQVALLGATGKMNARF